MKHTSEGGGGGGWERCSEVAHWEYDNNESLRGVFLFWSRATLYFERLQLNTMDEI